SDWYLPVNQPPFSGAHTNTPTSWSRHHGNTRVSTARTSMEYGGCSLDGAVTPRRSADALASASWSTENVEVPIAPTLPDRTNSSIACNVSSIGVATAR